jgi:pimeloyl-ACP methyl ester carboxylesterase
MNEKPATYAFFPGSFLHDQWYWDFTRQSLDRLGQNSVALNLPYDDIDATFEDHAATAKSQLQGEQNLVLVGYSRGANVALRVASELAVEQLVMLCPSLHPATTAPIQEHVPDTSKPAKNFRAYDDGLVRHPNGLWTIDRGAAKRRLFNKVTNVQLREAALDKLRPQRRSDDELPLAVWPEVKVRYIASLADLAITRAWTDYEAPNVFQVEPEYIPADHSPFLSWPDGLAAKLANQ